MKGRRFPARLWENRADLSGEVVRWGRQSGRVSLSDRRLRVAKPRLRSQAGEEVAVPAYRAMPREPLGDVNQNIYPQANLRPRLQAVKRLENACLAADAA